jgi:hypothetical protein
MQHSDLRLHMRGPNPLYSSGTDLFHLPAPDGQTVGDLKVHVESSFMGGSASGPVLAGSAVFSGQPVKLVRVHWGCGSPGSRVAYYLTWRRYDSQGQCLDPDPFKRPKKQVQHGPAPTGRAELVLSRYQRPGGAIQPARR